MDVKDALLWTAVGLWQNEKRSRKETCFGGGPGDRMGLTSGDSRESLALESSRRMNLGSGVQRRSQNQMEQQLELGQTLTGVNMDRAKAEMEIRSHAEDSTTSK